MRVSFCNNASLELTSVQSPVAVQPKIFGKGKITVNFVLTKVQVKLRGTLVWFDSGISLSQENFKPTVDSEMFGAAKMPVRTPREKVLECCVKNNEKIARNTGN